MFAKVFEQIFDSSIVEDYATRHVFMDLLVLADKHGHVDMTIEAIARRTNAPLDLVRRAIDKLSAEDPNSRTLEADGRRLVLLDSHRVWGWKIVNYDKYREMRDEEGRREYFRNYRREARAKSKESTSGSNDVQPVHIRSAPFTYTEADTDAIYIAQSSTKVSAKDVERIYQAYPRHIGRGKALKAIRQALGRLDSSTPGDDLLAIVEEYAKSRRGKDQQFTPYPATWFGQKRYLDDQEEWKKT